MNNSINNQKQKELEEKQKLFKEKWSPLMNRLRTMKPWGHLLSAILAFCGTNIVVQSSLPEAMQWFGIGAVWTFAIILSVVNEIGVSAFGKLFWRPIIGRHLTDRFDKIMMGLLCAMALPFFLLSPSLSGIGGYFSPYEYNGEYVEITKDSIENRYDYLIDSLTSDHKKSIAAKTDLQEDENKAIQKLYNKKRSYWTKYKQRHQAILSKHSWAQSHINLANDSLKIIDDKEIEHLLKTQDSYKLTAQRIQDNFEADKAAFDAKEEQALADLAALNLKQGKRHDKRNWISSFLLMFIGVFISIFLTLIYLAEAIYDEKTGENKTIKDEYLPPWYMIIYLGLGERIRLRSRLQEWITPKKKTRVANRSSQKKDPSASIPIAPNGTATHSKRPNVTPKPSQKTIVKTKTRVTDKCLVCGTDVTHLRSDVKTCSGKCRKKYNRQKA